MVDLRVERLELHEGVPEELAGLEDEGAGDEEAGGAAEEGGLEVPLELGVGASEEAGDSDPPEMSEMSLGPGRVNLLKESAQMSGHLKPRSRISFRRINPTNGDGKYFCRFRESTLTLRMQACRFHHS